jgi:hypothetical protein
MCKDCRWAFQRYPRVSDLLDQYTWHCNHPSSTDQPPPNLDTGAPEPPRQRNCPTIRAMPDNNHCGPSAQYWESRTDEGPKLSGEIGFGEALRWPDNIEDAFAAGDDGLFEWTKLSPG